MHRTPLALVLAAALVACAPVRPEGPPVPCAPGALRAAAELPLPPAAAAPKPVKGQPLRTATSVPIGGGIGDIGQWVAAGGGWQAWRLHLSSEGARSLSLHFKPMALPPGAQLWLCGAQGQRQGPYEGKGPSDTGDFWTPAQPGSEIWLEVIAPAQAAAAAELKIRKVFVGFRH